MCVQGRQLGRNRIGLLVDVTNPDAKRLYERLQFRVNKRRELTNEENSPEKSISIWSATCEGVACRRIAKVLEIAANYTLLPLANAQPG